MGKIALTPAQKQVVYLDSDIVCCACPGSGKTRVLVEKTKHLLTTRPHARIILTTFTRDAAREIRERMIEDEMPNAAMRRLITGTFHSLALKQLRKAGEAGHILNTIEINHVIYWSIREAGLTWSVEEATAKIEEAKIDERLLADKQTKALCDAYQHEMKRRGAQDFIDIMLRTNLLMAEGTLEPLPADYIFCDEFQDIDALQYQWVTNHIKAGMCGVAVGDDDQSIYGFRRALGYRGMMDFMAMTNAQLLRLETNFRSTKHILDAANRLIVFNIARVQKSLVSARGEGAKPVVIQTGSREEQYAKIVEELRNICKDNEFSDEDLARPESERPAFAVRAGQAAVLARTNNSLREIETFFRKHRVPYVRAGKSIWDAQLAQVYTSLLQSVVQRNSIGAEVALRWAGTNDATMNALNQAGQGNLWNLLNPARPLPPRLPCKAVEYNLITGIRSWSESLHRRHKEDDVVSVIRGTFDWLAGVVQKRHGLELNDEGRFELPALTQAEEDLQNRAIDGARMMCDTLCGYRGSMMERIQVTRRDSGQNVPRVVLATFHGSKGLEYDHVFLIDIVEGEVPKIEAGSTLSTMEEDEERRIFYVAMTRAADSLRIYCPGDKPSEFLAQAGLRNAELARMVA